MDQNLGRELLLTQQGLDHASEHLPRAKIEAALRSITHKGRVQAENGREDELITLSQNGVILVFRNNLVYTAFSADRDSEGYFKRQAKAPTKVKKGDPHGPSSGD